MSALCQIPVLLVPACTRVCIHAHMSGRAYARVGAYTRSTVRRSAAAAKRAETASVVQSRLPRLSTLIRREVACSYRSSVARSSLRDSNWSNLCAYKLIRAYPCSRICTIRPVVFINKKEFSYFMRHGKQIADTFINRVHFLVFINNI